MARNCLHTSNGKYTCFNAYVSSFVNFNSLFEQVLCRNILFHFFLAVCTSVHAFGMNAITNYLYICKVNESLHCSNSLISNFGSFVSTICTYVCISLKGLEHNLIPNLIVSWKCTNILLKIVQEKKKLQLELWSTSAISFPKNEKAHSNCLFSLKTRRLKIKLSSQLQTTQLAHLISFFFGNSASRKLLYMQNSLEFGISNAKVQINSSLQGLKL